MPARARTPRGKRRAGAWFLSVALLAAACGGSGDEDGATGSTSPTTTVDDTEVVVAGSRSAISFVSDDGSAEVGSRTVFVVTDVDSGEVYTAPVTGEGEFTALDLEVPPGTYQISTPEPSVSEFASYRVADVSAAEVTVSAPTDAEPEQIETVSFGLTVDVAPFVLRVDSVSATTVGLSWIALDGTDVGSYDLRFVEGTQPLDDAAAGTTVALGDGATSVVVEGLDQEQDYTFTMFATSSDGGDLPARSISATTSGLGADEPAYALAPNTILPTDFDSLEAELVGESLVRVTLDAGAIDRASPSEMPGLDDASLQGSGCVVGTPFLVSADVAGDNAFFGVIDSCDAGPAGWRQADGVSSAVVNTDVPLGAVFSYFDFSARADATCFDGETGEALDPGAAECVGGEDADGDGLDDGTETTIGTDPAVADSDGDGLDDFREYVELGTDPLRPDSDFDGLPDDEGSAYGTDPLAADTDEDGCWDTGELAANRDPLDAGDAGGDCPVPGDTDNWESTVDADRQAVRFSDEGGTPEVPEVDEPTEDPGEVDEVENLEAPENLGTGEVQVTLLWAAGDDLDLYVTEPSGDQISYSVTSSPSGGALDVDDRGGDCAEETTRAENVFWESGAPAGTYRVDVRNFTPCGDGALARVQVTVGGQIVIDRVVEPDLHDPIVFTVNEAPGAGFRDAGPLGSVGASTTPNVALAPDAKVNCESSGSTVLTLRPYIGPHHRVDFKLNWGGISWDFGVGVKASVNPLVKVEGSYTCALDLPSLIFQLTTTPVPINLELAPIVEGSAKATLEIQGPKLELTIGVSSKGNIDASTRYCEIDWFPDPPCGVNLRTSQQTGPFARFTTGPASATLTGELGLDLGIDARLGVGVKNSFVTAKTGFSFKITPVQARLKAVVGTSNCAGVSLGAGLAVDVLSEAYILKWGTERRIPLWEGSVTYPGAEFEIGNCPDD